MSENDDQRQERRDEEPAGGTAGAAAPEDRGPIDRGTAPAGDDSAKGGGTAPRGERPAASGTATAGDEPATHGGTAPRSERPPERGAAAGGDGPAKGGGTAPGSERRTQSGAATRDDEAATSGRAVPGGEGSNSGAAAAGEPARDAGTVARAGEARPSGGPPAVAEPPAGHPLPGPRRSWEDADLAPLPRPRTPAAEAIAGEQGGAAKGPGEAGGGESHGASPGEAGGTASAPGGATVGPRAEDANTEPLPSRRAATPAIGSSAAAAPPDDASRTGGDAAQGGDDDASRRAAGGAPKREPSAAPAAEGAAEPESNSAVAWPRPQRFEGPTSPDSPLPPAGGPAAGAPSPTASPLPSPRPRPPAGDEHEPPPPRPSTPPPPAAPERRTEAAEPGLPPPPAAERPPEPLGPPPPPAPAEPPTQALDDDVFADLASGAGERDAEAEERSYRELVRQVDSYREQGYDFYGLVGYPAAGKTHALKALAQRLHGFDASAREHFRRERAPVPTEAWPFYYAHTGSHGERWVFMDPGGELYYRLRSNDWRLAEASAGLLHTIGHCRGLFLLLHLTRGHLGSGATGFARGMDDDERQRETEAQKAQEEIELFDQFLLFARALAAERGDVGKLVRRAADAGLDEALRPYHRSPRLAAPVAVLFTQADRLAGGMDFAGVDGTYAAPQSEHFRTAPFVARNLPTLLTTLLRHARRFRFDFVQSYVEKPAAGGEGLPLWSFRNEPLSVGLVPALEYLLRRSPGGGGRGAGGLAIDTRTALRLHRLLHPRLWDGIEVDL